MVNRNLKNIADQIGSKVLPKDRPVPLHALKDYEYIPALKAYVASKISFEGKSWREHKFSEPFRGFSMLTPREFFIFYDHCKENRPDIIENIKSMEEGRTYEYLSCLLDHKDKKYIINLKIDSKKKVVGEKIMLTEGGSLFRREDINEHGLPGRLHSLRKNQKCEFVYAHPDMPTNRYSACVLSTHRNSNAILLMFANTVFAHKPEKLVGYRPVFIDQKRATTGAKI